MLWRYRIRIDDTLEEYVAEAGRHPLFELRPITEAAGSAAVSNDKEGTVKAKETTYWVSTILIATETLVGAVSDLTQGRTILVSGPRVVDVVTSLGYPPYVLKILGVWKLLGGIVLLLPGWVRLKEWAYAGITFELSGAAASHAARGQAKEVIAPLGLLGLALTSWALRPPRRTLSAGGAAQADGRRRPIRSETAA